MKSFSHTSAIILSAGKSERMGEPKALLKYNENKTFIQKITETYLQAGIEQVIVVLNSELFDEIKKENINLPSNIEIAINDNPEWGRFYSLQCGLKYLKPDHYCFFQNIDNLFTTVQTLRSLIQHKVAADVIIPTFHDKSGHPVLFNSKVAQKILIVWDPHLRIDHFFRRLNIKKVEVNESGIFSNINSREDYIRAGLGI